MENIFALPAEHCIYCGKIGGTLSDEHVVAYGLGGRHILPRSSCTDCQVRINKQIETPLLQNMLLPIRARHRYPTRKTSRSTVRAFRIESVLEKHFRLGTVDYPRKNYPGPTFMASVVDPPRIFTGTSPEEPVNLALAADGITAEIMERQGGSIFGNFPPLDFVHKFARMLAKIAHSYMYFQGLPFTSLMLPIMNEQQNPWTLIGRAERKPEVIPGQKYHLCLREVGNLYIVSVSLLLDTSLDVHYDVVVGLKY